MKQETLTASEYRKRAGLTPPGADRAPKPPPAEREKMNKTEAAYADRLDLLRRAGTISRWRFEPISLQLADGTRYRPDFLIEFFDEMPEIHEVKGYMRDDARVKIQVAASLYPMFRFFVVRRARHEWDITEVARMIGG